MDKSNLDILKKGKKAEDNKGTFPKYNLKLKDKLSLLKTI
jgi:hypothetical protein